MPGPQGKAIHIQCGWNRGKHTVTQNSTYQLIWRLWKAKKKTPFCSMNPTKANDVQWIGSPCSRGKLITALAKPCSFWQWTHCQSPAEPALICAVNAVVASHSHKQANSMTQCRQSWSHELLNNQGSGWMANIAAAFPTCPWIAGCTRHKVRLS